MTHGAEKLIGLYEPWRQWCAYVVAVVDRMGFNPRIVSGTRTLREQEQLYKSARAGRSKLPAAPPGRSPHNYGLAIDVWASTGNQDAMMRVFQHYGGELVRGDPPHVQYPGFRKALGQ